MTSEAVFYSFVKITLWITWLAEFSNFKSIPVNNFDLLVTEIAKLVSYANCLTLYVSKSNEKLYLSLSRIFEATWYTLSERAGRSPSGWSPGQNGEVSLAEVPGAKHVWLLSPLLRPEGKDNLPLFLIVLLSDPSSVESCSLLRDAAAVPSKSGPEATTPVERPTRLAKSHMFRFPAIKPLENYDATCLDVAKFSPAGVLATTRYQFVIRYHGKQNHVGTKEFFYFIFIRNKERHVHHKT